MFAFLRLIRFQNLVIIAVSQALARYCLIMPAYQTAYNNIGIFPSHLSKIDFILLVLSAVLIAAAGNIINDVFDVRADEINKPGKNSIGKLISAETGRKLYYIFSATGIAIGFYLAAKIEKPVMGFINVFAAGSLWMYSSYYKKRLLMGNVVIALLSGLALLMVGLFEPEFYPNITYLLIYSGFAFAVTLIREIIKDMEDLDGDERTQCKTLPVVAGIKKSKAVVLILIVITVVMIGYILVTYFYRNNVISFWNLLAMFEIPFLALAYLVITASEKKDFRFASTFTKIVMVLGVFSLFPFYYFFLR
jgi:4-hydroxybenzoate polyprenyltransferase